MALGNTAKRVLVSIVAIPAILAACYFGGYFFFIFVLGISLISYYEFSSMVRNKGMSTNIWIGFIAIIFLISNQFKYFFNTYSFVLILVVLITLFELFRNKGSAIENIGSSLLGIFYIGFFASTLIGIREFYNAGGEFYSRGGYLIISLLATIWVCDSAAFFGGTAFGKHKLFPRVSPNKSWEGAGFGFVFAIITMILAKIIVLQFLSWGQVVLMGAIVGTIGQIGDLIESLLKRDAGVKDSSNLIPGHGGIFDRFDSLLYTAPVIFLFLKYVVGK